MYRFSLPLSTIFSNTDHRWIEPHHHNAISMTVHFFFGHFARHIFRIFFPQYLHIIVIEGSLCLFYGADRRGYHLLAWTISSRLKKIFAEQIFPETPCHFLKTQLVIWNAWIIITFFLAHTNDQVLSASCRLW